MSSFFSFRFRVVAAILLLALSCAALFADFAVYGDTQAHAGIHRQIVAGIVSHHPDLAFHTGDLTDKGTKEANWDRFFEISAPLLEICPLYPAMGNHEKSSDLFLQHFPALDGRTYYTVGYNGLLCIVLDTTQDLLPNSEQYNWLRETLIASPDQPKAVFMHRPLFSSGMHGGDTDLSLILPAMFADRKVLAVFAGHDHDYERLEYKGTAYIVCGGGGGALRAGCETSPYSKVFRVAHSYVMVSFDGTELRGKVYGLAGELLDEFSVPASR